MSATSIGCLHGRDVPWEHISDAGTGLGAMTEGDYQSGLISPNGAGLWLYH